VAKAHGFSEKPRVVSPAPASESGESSAASGTEG